MPLARRRGAGALATNWAGNIHRALGCVDAAVYFRNKLESDSSGATQARLSTCCQCAPSLGGRLDRSEPAFGVGYSGCERAR